jgi:hypothetical protein
MTTRPKYEALKQLARDKRAEHGVTTTGLGPKVVRDIYRAEGVRIDSWKMPARIRAAYMCDGGDPSVAISKSLPTEPKLFSLMHELKHNYGALPSFRKNSPIRCLPHLMKSDAGSTPAQKARQSGYVLRYPGLFCRSHRENSLCRLTAYGGFCKMIAPCAWTAVQG